MPNQHILHILAQEKDALQEHLLHYQSNLPATSIRVIDLHEEQVDYHDLLDAIFAASSVQVW